MEERARFDRLDDSLGGTAPSESAGLPALDRLQRTASGSLPGSPEVHQGQEGEANEEALRGKRWSEGESREAYKQSLGQEEEQGEGAGTPGAVTPGDGTPGDGQGEEPWKGAGTQGAGTPGSGTTGDGTAGDGTPLQSPSATSDRFPPSASLTGFNGAPASSLHDRRMWLGAGGRSARFAQMQRSSSKHLVSDVIPGWKPRGRLNMEMTVLQHKTVWEKALNAYNFVIKLSLVRFVLCVLLAPILLAALFTPLFLLKWRGFAVQQGYDDGWINQDTLTHAPGAECPMTAAGVCQALAQRTALALHVFIFALSLCTSFGGSPLSALSPGVVFLSNVLTLCAQLLFVFVSGAVFARIARPGSNLLAADRIIISYQVVPGTGPDVKRVLFTRLALVGFNTPELINVTMSINFRIFMATSTGSYFVPVENLSLVTRDVPLLRFGFMVRHIIDETSPLYEYSEEDLLRNDASFMVSVSGLERSSMHPFFYKRDYWANDGDIVYDRDFEDMLVIGKGGSPTFDHSRLHLLRPETSSRG